MPLKIIRSISVNEQVAMTNKEVNSSPPNGLYRCQANSFHSNQHPTSPLAREVAPTNEEILTAVVYRRKKNKSRSKSPSARHSAHIVTDLSYRNSFIDISPMHRCQANGGVSKRNSYVDASPSRGNRNSYVMEASPSHSCHSFQSPVHSNESPQRSNGIVGHVSRRRSSRSPFRNLPSSQSSHEFYSSPVRGHPGYNNQQGNRHSYVVGVSPMHHTNGSPAHSNYSPAHSNGSPSHGYVNYPLPMRSNFSPAHSNCSQVHSNQSTPSHRKDRTKRHSCIEISPSHSDSFYDNPMAKYHDYAEISPSHQPLPSSKKSSNRHSFIESKSSQSSRNGSKHSNRQSCASEMLPSRGTGIYDNVDLSGVVLRRKPPPADTKPEPRASPIREIIRRFSLRYKKKKPEKTERPRPRKYPLSSASQATMGQRYPKMEGHRFTE